MKTYVIMVALAITSLTFGQGINDSLQVDEEGCKRNRSYYPSYYQQNMFMDARNFWLKAFYTCGGTESLDGKYFRNGKRIYLQLIKEFGDEQAASLYDSIAWIYDEGMKVDHELTWQLDYAKFLTDRRDERVGKIDTLFALIDSLQEETHPKYLRSYFKHLILNHYNKSPDSDKDSVVNRISQAYFRLYGYSYKALQQSEGPEGSVSHQEHLKTHEYLDNYFLRLIPSAAKMKEILIDNFDSLSDDLSIRLKEVNRAIKLLEKKEAELSEIYTLYVHEYVLLNPSHEGYYTLGKLEMSQGKYAKAILLFNQALATDSLGESLHLYRFELAKALYAHEQYTSAFQIAKHIEGEYRAEALMLCGDCIAWKAPTCGNSTFDRQANYWLANDYYRMASNLQEGVNTTKYLSNAPDNEECWQNNVKEGDEIELECWKETTKVRIQE